jgi:hypothetical protein
MKRVECVPLQSSDEETKGADYEMRSIAGEGESLY